MSSRAAVGALHLLAGAVSLCSVGGWLIFVAGRKGSESWPWTPVVIKLHVLGIDQPGTSETTPNLSLQYSLCLWE